MKVDNLRLPLGVCPQISFLQRSNQHGFKFSQLTITLDLFYSVIGHHASSAHEFNRNT